MSEISRDIIQIRLLKFTWNSFENSHEVHFLLTFFLENRNCITLYTNKSKLNAQHTSPQQISKVSITNGSAKYSIALVTNSQHQTLNPNVKSFVHMGHIEFQPREAML
jgi:hypothetical protein